MREAGASAFPPPAPEAPVEQVAGPSEHAPSVTVDNAGRVHLMAQREGQLWSATFEGAGGITNRVERGKTKGVPYKTISDWKGIVQLDRKDDQHALVVRETADGALNLETLPFP